MRDFKKYIRECARRVHAEILMQPVDLIKAPSVGQFNRSLSSNIVIPIHTFEHSGALVKESTIKNCNGVDLNCLHIQFKGLSFKIRDVFGLAIIYSSMSKIRTYK